MKYEKPWLDFHQQLDLLTERGLVVPNRLRATRWLRQVSYYRLSAYCLPFKPHGSQEFFPGTSFDDVAGLYIFDRKLRLILLDAIERIEVALRAHLTHAMSQRDGPFGYADKKSFGSNFDHEKLMQEVREGEIEHRETFVAHFRQKYTDEKHLPIWMAMELLSFGCMSRIFQDATLPIKKVFASRLDVIDNIAINWMHTLCYIRNVCAHHKRLWNRHLAIKPKLPQKAKWFPYAVAGNDRLYAVLVIIRHSLLRLSPACQWRRRLFELFDAHPTVSLEAMGIPNDWRDQSPWLGEH